MTVLELVISAAVAFAATFSGVAYAQRKANKARDEQLAREKSEHVDKRTSLLVESLDAALSSVWRAQAILQQTGRAPLVRIHAGFIASQADAAIEVYGPNRIKFRELMIAALMIEVANDRLVSIARFDELFIVQGADAHTLKEHAAQVADALRYLKLLEDQIESALEYLDPDRLKEARSRRAELFATPAVPKAHADPLPHAGAGTRPTPAR